MSVAKVIEVGTVGWHDQLDVLAGRDDVTTLAVWAARAADANGDPVKAREWAQKAAEAAGRLF